MVRALLLRRWIIESAGEPSLTRPFPRLWDVATRSAIRVLSGDPEGYRIAYSADGRLFAASSLGGSVRVWDASTGRELAVLPHGGRAYGLAFSPDGSRLATCCSDHTVRLWDVSTLQEVCEPLEIGTPSGTAFQGRLE
jgi:WD40 repeat protein